MEKNTQKQNRLREITTDIASIGDGEYVNSAGSIDDEFIQELEEHERRLIKYFIGMLPDSMEENRHNLDFKYACGFNQAIDEIRKRMENK
jgi:hypothetical protein